MQRKKKEETQRENIQAVFSDEINITTDGSMKIALFKSNRDQWRWEILLRLLHSLYQINISDVNIDRLSLLINHSRNTIKPSMIDVQHLLDLIYRYTAELCHVQLRIVKLTENFEDNLIYSLGIY